MQGVGFRIKNVGFRFSERFQVSDFGLKVEGCGAQDLGLKQD